jgi:hypothetical protein
MAKVLGETARYVTKQSIKKYQREFIAINLASFFLALIIGLWLGLSLNKQAYLWIIISIFIVALILFLTTQLTNRVTNKLEKKRIDFRKGATGEALVGFILEGFPDAYTVIHGLKPKRHSGDIDHIVVGPTGVYAIDTKNWKGVIEADSKGELLHNGSPTDKAEAQNLFDLTMFIKNKVKTFAGLELFIYAVLVFPCAWVKVKKVAQGYVECKTDEELADYIVKKKKGKKLKKNEIDAILRAICKGTEIEEDFIHYHE